MTTAVPSTQDSSKTQAKSFPVDENVFVLDPSHYGSFGKVVGQNNNGKMVVAFLKHKGLTINPERYIPTTKEEDNFMPIWLATQRGEFHYVTFSKITSAVFLVDKFNKCHNVGLNLKSRKRNEERPGYVRKQGNAWVYSHKTLELVHRYRCRFPELFHYLDNTTDEKYYLEKIYPHYGDKKIKEIHHWLKHQEHNLVNSIVSGSKFLSAEAIETLKKDLKNLKMTPTKYRGIFSPESLCLVNSNFDNLTSVAEKYCLLDRVIVCRTCVGVPVGTYGFIIGIYAARRPGDISNFNILFEPPFAEGIPLQDYNPNNAYTLSGNDFINISHHVRSYSPDPNTLLAGSAEAETVRNEVRNNVKKLFLYLVKNKFGAPWYRTQVLDNGFIIADVHLPNGESYHGLPCSTKFAAHCSAARMACIALGITQEEPEEHGGEPLPRHFSTLHSNRQVSGSLPHPHGGEEINGTVYFNNHPFVSPDPAIFAPPNPAIFVPPDPSMFVPSDTALPPPTAAPPPYYTFMPPIPNGVPISVFYAPMNVIIPMDPPIYSPALVPICQVNPESVVVPGQVPDCNFAQPIVPFDEQPRDGQDADPMDFK